MRQKSILALPPGDLVDLLAADAAVLDPDQHLADIELWQLDLVDLQRRVLFDEDGGLHDGVTPATGAYSK